MVKEYTLNQLAELIIQRLNEDFDVVMAVSGDTGTGKSTLALKLAIKIKELLGQKLDLDKDIAFTQDDVMQWINANQENPKSVLVVDEAVNVAYSRDFMKRENKALNKIFDMMRSKNLCLMLNIPYFKSLDTHIRNRAKIWLYVDARGHSYIFLAEKNPAKLDKWDLKLLEKLWESNSNLVQYSAYKGYIRFKALPEDIETAYNKFKNEKRALIEQKEMNDTPRLRLKCPRCNLTDIIHLRRENCLRCRKCGNLFNFPANEAK